MKAWAGRGRERTVRLNAKVWESFRRHVAQMTRTYRDYPSVIFHQIDNELVYNNGMNLYGGDLTLIDGGGRPDSWPQRAAGAR